MKNKKISIRVIFPVVMSASIAACIISCILLFSYYFSTYFQKDAIEKIGKQREFLAQSLETQIENINVLINRIYYQNIKKYDVDSARFAEEMEQQIFLEEKCLYGLALYDMRKYMAFRDICRTRGCERDGLVFTGKGEY